jgi:hypothetical protein
LIIGPTTISRRKVSILERRARGLSMERSGEGGRRSTGGAVPRGPPEWGDLIYQEPWAHDRRIPGKYDPLRIIGIEAFGAVILLMGLTFLLDGELILAAMYLGPSLLLLVGSVDLLVKMRHTLPFRIYARGVVLAPKEAKARDYREEEHFVPFDRIERVFVKQDDWKGGPSTFLKFVLVDDLDEGGHIVSPARGTEAGPIVDALGHAFPELEVERVG